MDDPDAMKEGLTTNTRARVAVTLEISCISNWNKDATVDQVHRQALADARQRLVSVFNAGGVRVVGDPTVTMILVDSK
jgi:hypothetical protein